MELRHLRYFVSVAEADNISRAALHVHVSQPALSRQIRDLETELGVRLFDRVGRRIRLTPEGADVLRRAREILMHADLLSQRARALGRGTVGLLRVGATPQLIQSPLSAFLVRYQRSRPEIDVRLTEDGGVRLLDLLQQGELHVALSAVAGSSRLAHRLLFPIRVLALAADTTRWARRKTVEVKDLAGEPLLLLQRRFTSRQLFEAACRIAHIEPRVVLETDDPHSLVALAAAGHGIAITPSTVRFVPKNVRMMPILQAGTSLGTWGGASWDPRRALPSCAVAFIEDVAAHLPRVMSGRQFERLAPPVPRPPAPDGGERDLGARGTLATPPKQPTAIAL